MILDAYAQASNLVFMPNRYGDTVETKVKGRQIVFIKPSTFMNLSGKSVRYWMQKEKVEMENVLIFTDDINLPFGKIRIRTKGSDGGHNGLKSIIELTNNQEFARVRYGIGKVFKPGEQVDYVLGELSVEEKDMFDKSKKKCIDIINAFVTIGLERTMNLYN